MKLLQSLFVVFVFFGSTSSYSDDNINIAAILALTGQYSMQVNAFREGLTLAVDEINSNGGINSRQINLIIEDSANDPKLALSAAQKVLQQSSLSAAILSSYPEYKTAGVEFQNSKVPCLTLWDSSPDIDAMGDYIFGIGPWTPSSGESAANFSHQILKAKTAIIFNSIDPWAELVSDYFEASFKESGGKILDRFSLNPDTNDFRTVLSKAKTKKPDVIYSPITQNIPAFYKQIKQLNLNIPIVSSDVISDGHISEANNALEGVYQTTIKDPNSVNFKVLANLYKNKFDSEPKLPWFVATAYDSIKLIEKAILDSGTSGNEIKSALYKIQNYQGATQSYSFNAKGSAPQISGISKIINGRFVWFWPTE